MSEFETGEQAFPALEDWWASGNEDYCELEQLVAGIKNKELTELQAFKQRVMELQPVGYVNECRDYTGSVISDDDNAFDEQTVPLYDLKELKC